MPGRSQPPYEVSNSYPPRGSMRQYRLTKPVTFRCMRCKTDKTSRLVATVSGDWSRLICNACYALLSFLLSTSQANPTPQRKASTPSTAPRALTNQGTTGGPASEGQVVEKLAGELRKDIQALAALHRQRAEGTVLSRAQRMALDKLATSSATAAALLYAALLIEGDVLIASLRGDQSARIGLLAARASLNSQSGEFLKQHQRRDLLQMERVGDPEPSPDHLDARVMRYVGGEAFEAVLTRVMADRGLRRDVTEVPRKDLWDWLEAIGVNPTYSYDKLPSEVRRLRQLDDDAFVDMLVADAREGRFRALLRNHGLVERWATQGKAAEARLRAERRQAEKELIRTPSNARDAAHVDRFKDSVRAYAHASAQSRMAELTLSELKVYVARVHRRPRFQQLRAECLNQAAAEFAHMNPALASAVTASCADHRAVCNMASDPHPCADCVPVVAAEVHVRQVDADDALGEKPLTEAEPAAAPESPAGAAQGIDRGAADNQPDVFVCDAVRRELPQHLACLTAVVAVHFDRRAGIVGFAWLTEEGELRTGTDRAVDPHDGWVQGICRTLLDLASGTSHVQVACRDDKAANVVRHVLRAGLVPQTLGFPVTDHTRLLLAEVIRHRKRSVVSIDRCPEEHMGAASAERLAALASRAGQGLESGAAVQAEADRVSDELGRAAGPRLTAPAEEDDHAWWVAGEPGGAELVWQTALYRMHLDGGWCVLPDGRAPIAKDRQRVQLRIEHRERVGRSAPVTQYVTLRQRGGQWEIGGIEWPKGLLPGTVVTFNWSRGGTLASARRELLPKPQRVDELEFLHRYDPQVVTRETAPGADQDRDVPDLSDASWVMRTLRKLGYLSVDGEAILAEDALVRNCLELGLPPHRADRIGQAVDQLLGAGRLQRVEGSVDYDGRPWYPARPGHVRTPLLRYVPQIQAVTSSRVTAAEWHPHRRGHWVAGFVRRLPPGAQASAEQIEAHRDAVRASELVDRDLPDGFTYVRRHHRSR